MFVGGPNTRTDFHLDESPEFFWQLKGNMQLPIIERGKKQVVEIKEGEVFLLPSRIPHSPQRPEAGSLGLVIERARVEGKEFDALRWYTDFDKCDEILWEKYFYCDDLGRDLVPVVEEFKASEAFATGRPTVGSVVANPPLRQDCTRETKYDEFIEKNEAFLYVFRGGIEVSNNGIDPRVVKAGECLILSGGKFSIIFKTQTNRKYNIHVSA
ncbi:3-hydroxyanthranilate 3,4-dioxygenase, putative [Perkinsus marinus ATCC 50983]|uniref:3-hydroxyanthranilate 3,4-dioxygenase, putative n=1 Tax=Perkinsus marinus (strain ATCC 50983 / TXsc) TaxID=423536 RepID=C5KS19_PERM5|nr:3-hydroxyanthranilate 3,4-dioxygenase, putative [Perkinsus marinus ATCC 50983]EER12710.1 3-hydroxyanthranilate 3,4-dioxygenase, putative [Perkinsus marinus ATCC 50983]|eukprot:XP_002780915.1 3-hydroxyanthranilate 3,4-dioxygenase, putative [Perkinsus marinus ATCC 50983]